MTKVDNRKLAKIAKLAGAPEDKAAGIDFLTPVGTKLEKGQTLYVIHADSKGELEYALEYYHSQKDILTIK
jgi:thymidine phosphorylase